ncbi:MAG: RagB/SusD family nutrient uptake outer membrane protein [Cyclobacteriaceae bacterium]
MKNLDTIKLVVASFFALMMTSCSSGFLVEEPNTSLTEEEVYSDQESLQLLVAGLYTQWRDTRKDRSALYFTMGTDEAQQGGQQVQENNVQAALDKYNGALNPTNSVIAGEWNKRWPIVSAASKAVFFAQTDQLSAEAAFLRAAVNFELAMLWGPIPIVEQGNTLEARQPLADVYNFIIRDLELAVEFLPITQSDKRFPTKGAAEALLGKVYMYAPEESNVRDYQKALEYFDLAIPKYSLLPNYGDLFNTLLDQNSSEVIYGFQFNNIEPDNNQVQHQAGSRAVADVDANTYFGGYDLAVPTEYYHTDIWVGETGDTRKAASIRENFVLPDGRVPTITWTNQPDELEPHTKKYEDIRTQGSQNFWYSGGMIYFLRLGDILLNKAECLNELGRTGEAIQLVNSTVRARAFGGTLPDENAWVNMSQDEFRDNMLDERMRELAFEGWRRMDLIRTGNLIERVSEHNPWANESGTLQPFHVRYPIPESEIKQNQAINEEDQNPGY